MPLSGGVAEILKLSRAKVGEETILTFITSSAKTYNLSAADIVYLKEQGVSDAVLTAMLQQSQKPAKTEVAPAPPPQAAPAAQAVAQVAPAEQVAPVATTPNSPEAVSPQYAPAASAPASTTYVVPSTAYSYPYYYSSYPYYYPYYGYPAVTFAFGFGGGYYGGYHGCYPGGYHGGWHGGGHH
jgi:hypothetical protein